MITNASIVPGEGLGNSIRLGRLMYSIINLLDRFHYRMKISYSEKHYLETPITVTVPDIGLRMVFENSDKQELVLIEVIDFKSLKLNYNGINLNDIAENTKDTYEIEAQENSDIVPTVPKWAENEDLQQRTNITLPNLKQIYNQTSGPTYPGKLSKNSDYYTLSYPGISFKFKINLNELINKLIGLGTNVNDNTILSKLLNWDKSSDIACESLSIYLGSSWENFYETFQRSILDSKQTTKLRNKASSSAIHISKLLVNLKLGIIKLIFEATSDKNRPQEYVIKIGETTQQEVLNILGSPDDYFNKFDSRLLIHNHLSKSFKIDLHDNSIYKFHNYFRFGLDFLYDLNSSKSKSTGVLKKLIIHNGGIIESLDFMKWNKCNWQLISGQYSDTAHPFELQDDISIDSSMYFNDIPPEFFNKIEGNTSLRPVLLNRNETEFIDNDLDIINPDEISDNNNTILEKHSSRDSTVSGHTSKTKTWGQSKLIGCNRCIWEVVESNGCITSITIF